MSEKASAMAAKLSDALEREPFAPFVIETIDGRRILVKNRGSAVVNTLAVSVIEEAFSITVITL